MTELVTVAEYFERTLEQDCKQKSTKAIDFKVITAPRPAWMLGSPTSQSHKGVYHSNADSGVDVSVV